MRKRNFLIRSLCLLATFSASAHYEQCPEPEAVELRVNHDGSLSVIPPAGYETMVQYGGALTRQMGNVTFAGAWLDETTLRLNFVFSLMNMKCSNLIGKRKVNNPYEADFHLIKKTDLFLGSFYWFDFILKLWVNLGDAKLCGYADSYRYGAPIATSHCTYYHWDVFPEQ